MKLASLHLKASELTLMALVPILLLETFIEQAKLLNIKYDCVVNRLKDFMKELSLFSSENQKGRKEGGKEILEALLFFFSF